MGGAPPEAGKLRSCGVLPARLLGPALWFTAGTLAHWADPPCLQAAAGRIRALHSTSAHLLPIVLHGPVPHRRQEPSDPYLMLHPGDGHFVDPRIRAAQQAAGEHVGSHMTGLSLGLQCNLPCWHVVRARAAAVFLVQDNNEFQQHPLTPSMPVDTACSG